MPEHHGDQARSRELCPAESGTDRAGRHAAVLCGAADPGTGLAADVWKQHDRYTEKILSEPGGLLHPRNDAASSVLNPFARARTRRGLFCSGHERRDTHGTLFEPAYRKRCAMYSDATNVNEARRAIRLPGHQCFDYLVKRPLIYYLQFVLLLGIPDIAQ